MCVWCVHCDISVGRRQKKTKRREEGRRVREREREKGRAEGDSKSKKPAVIWAEMKNAGAIETYNPNLVSACSHT